MVVKCPRCGGNVAWDMGEWECIECGYRFKVERKITADRKEPAPTPPPPTAIIREKKEEAPEFKQKYTKWVVISLVLLIAGLLSGYAFGIISTQTGSTVTRTVFITTISSTTVSTTVPTTITVTVESPLVPRIEPNRVYSIKLLDVMLDEVFSPDYNYYVMNLEASYTGDRKWIFNPLYLKIISDRKHDYVPLMVHDAIRRHLQGEELVKEETITGQIAFMIPKEEKPVKLVYDDPLLGISFEVGEIPSPSKHISYVYSVDVYVKSEYLFILTTGTKKTPYIALYSGETFEVELNVKYDRLLDNPPKITVASIDVEGFEIVETIPRLPLSINDDEEAKIRLILKVPEKGYKGNLKITISA